HMLDLNWKFLVPLSLAAIVFVAVTDKVIQQYLPGTGPWVRAGILLLANLLLGWLTIVILRASARRMRQAETGGAGGPTAEAHSDEHAHAAIGEAHAAAH
ncbi:MAG: hypothetical protein ACRDH2_10200, partial [Anaerolineales bacterium]